MTFAQKLKFLTDDRIKSKLCRRAGLSTTAMSDYITKGYLPRSDKALRIARVLGVSMEWPYVDERDLPAIPANEMTHSHAA